MCRRFAAGTRHVDLGLGRPELQPSGQSEPQRHGGHRAHHRENNSCWVGEPVENHLLGIRLSPSASYEKPLCPSLCLCASMVLPLARGERSAACSIISAPEPASRVFGRGHICRRSAAFHFFVPLFLGLTPQAMHMPRLRRSERLSNKRAPVRGRHMDSPGCEPRILRYIVDGHPA